MDRRLYEFAPPGRRRQEKLDGNPQTVLADNNQCILLLLPSAPAVYFSYGVDRGRVLAAGRAAYAASFGLRLHDRSTDERFELFRDTVESDSERWREKTLDLSPWSLRWVELCVETVEVDGSPEAATEDFAFWSNLVVIAGDDPVPDDPSPEALTDEEAEARREHLRALGYIQ